MSFQHISLKKDDRVRILELNFPPVNSLSPELVGELGRAVDEVEGDPDARVLLITSAVNTFVAGADIKAMNRMLSEEPPSAFGDYLGRLNAVLNRIERLPALSIAVINGHALGGGCELSLACDFRFMVNEPAAKIGLPEAQLGLLPGAGGTQRLGRLVGRSRAMDLIINSRSLSPQEAYQIGLVHRLFPPASLFDQSLEEAKRLAGGPSRAYAQIKRCLVEGLERDLYGGLQVEREGILNLIQTVDAKEGLSAFIEKRKPHFAGR